MVLVRLSHFVFQVVLIFLALENIQALDLKGKFTARDEGGITKMESDVPTRTWDGFSFNRKMMMKLEQVLYTHEASNVSGATNSAEKSRFEVKQKLKTKSKLMSTNAHSNVILGNFMVFNADYHVPRPHPPKNN
ncbi:hypothetical protein LIER_42332 [Lithospermum erythrorhizon]|uniref:Uncharacterized protein n=1 Tax=Lithospermum erythrorhizon TaxID=34254 RepID=A0AAV3RQ63_LITER